MIHEYMEAQQKSLILQTRTHHSTQELHYIEDLIWKHMPHLTVEIGTGRGGLTLLFGLYAKIFYGEVITVDLLKEPGEIAWRRLKPVLPITFIQGDAWTQETVTIIKDKSHRRKTFFYLDGGDKTQDLKTYAPLTKPGDTIATHDANQVDAKTLHRLVKQHNLKKLRSPKTIHAYHRTEPKPKNR